MEISSLESRHLTGKSSKKGKKYGVSLGMKKDKSRPVISSSVNGHDLKKTVPTVPVRLKKFLQFDVMNDKINIALKF